jgi:hypothetical protein
MVTRCVNPLGRRTIATNWDCREFGGARPEEVLSSLYSR